MSEPVLEYSAPRRPPARGSRAVTILCWTILLVIAVGLPTLRAINSRAKPAAAGATPATIPSGVATTQPIAEPIDFQLEMIGKYVVGAGDLNRASADQLMTQLDMRATAPEQKIAAAVVAVELGQRDGGLKRIDQSESPDRFEFSALYRDHTPLPADFVARYGFFGRLAATDGMAATSPQRQKVLAEARKTVYLSGAVFVVLVVLTVAGFGLLVTAVVLAAMGKIRVRVEAPRGPAPIYIEAFTIYIGGFIAGSLLLQWLAPAATLAVHGLMMLGVVVLGIVWPMLRGVPWSQQRSDWGLYVANPVIEIASGLIGYVAGLPVVAAGILVTVLLMQQSQTVVSHPIVQEVAGHPFLVLILASVFAPLTEETLFRGALLSHLRAGIGPVVTAVITGLMFASVHPQGWAAIPALGSIGFVLAMIRQWRGSLLASMAAHALNNGAVILLVLAMQ